MAQGSCYTKTKNYENHPTPSPHSCGFVFIRVLPSPRFSGRRIVHKSCTYPSTRPSAKFQIKYKPNQPLKAMKPEVTQHLILSRHDSVSFCVLCVLSRQSDPAFSPPSVGRFVSFVNFCKIGVYPCSPTSRASLILFWLIRGQKLSRQPSP